MTRASGAEPVRVGISTGPLPTDSSGAAVEWVLLRLDVEPDPEILDGLSGVVLGSASPSRGRKALAERFPLLPVETQDRLHDPAVREGFFDRLFAYRRFRDLERPPCRMADLVAFHAAQKYLVLAHSPEHYRKLGRLVAGARGEKRRAADVVTAYGALLMEALAVRATRGKHANVLLHVIGFLKNVLDSADKRELVETVERYRRGLVPLAVPISLVNSHVRRHDVPWVKNQVYLAPHTS